MKGRPSLTAFSAGLGSGWLEGALAFPGEESFARFEPSLSIEDYRLQSNHARSGSHTAFFALLPSPFPKN